MTYRSVSLALLFMIIGCSSGVAEQVGEASISPADTVWMLVATALVLLMTPALALFYGGLVRSKNALNTMMMSFIALSVAGVLWPLIGYSVAFGKGNFFVGDLSMAFLNGVELEPKGTIPHLLFFAFQGTFAIITLALISGAVVERMRFATYLFFIAIWSVVVYAPVTHWVWGGGWIAEMGALDFAGGTVVHINAGAAAVVAALMLGTRRDYGRQALLPHNVPFVLLGAGILWFGWFGFNGGSALAADSVAVLAFVNTMLAPAGTVLVWTLLDMVRIGKTTAVGVATAIVVGLVAITPAAGFISPGFAIVLGALAAAPSYSALLWRARTRLDDSLDVFAAHGVGGITGALLTGVFAEEAVNGIADGLFFGNVEQFFVQAISVIAVFMYSALLTFLILKGLSLAMPLRVASKDESIGLDIVNHGEEAYTSGEGALLLLDDEAPGVIINQTNREIDSGSKLPADTTTG